MSLGLRKVLDRNSAHREVHQSFDALDEPVGIALKGWCSPDPSKHSLRPAGVYGGSCSCQLGRSVSAQPYGQEHKKVGG